MTAEDAKTAEETEFLPCDIPGPEGFEEDAGDLDARLDMAFLGETTAEARFAAACEDVPTKRIERLLSAINSHIAKVSRGLDYVDSARDFSSVAEARLGEILGVLVRLESGGAILKSEAVAKELRDLRVLMSDGETIKRSGVKGLLMGVRNSLASCKKAVEFIDRSDIAKIRVALKDLSGFHAAVHSVLVADLPAVAEESADGTLLDNGNWAGLMVGIKKAHPAEKPALIAMAMRRLTEDMDKAARQIVKLGQRTVTNGATEAEAAVAGRRAIALKASVSTMRRRLVALSSAFFRHRARQLEAIYAATKTAVDAAHHESMGAETLMSVKEFLHRHPAKRCVDDIVAQDVRLESGKGMNPHQGYSMAALMRKFKDNYVERITNNGKADNA